MVSFLSWRFRYSVTVGVIPNTGEPSSLNWLCKQRETLLLSTCNCTSEKMQFLVYFFLCSCIKGQILWGFFWAVLVFFEPASHNNYLLTFPLDIALHLLVLCRDDIICVELCCLDPANNTVALGYIFF